MVVSRVGVEDVRARAADRQPVLEKEVERVMRRSPSLVAVAAS
jgi:hypothetical protein